MDELSLGKRLKELRSRGGLTLQQVADGAGLSKSFVSQVETGAAQPSIASLKRIGDVLGIPLAALFEDEDQPSVEASSSGAGPLDAQVRVVKRDHRKRLHWPTGGSADLLTPDLQGKLEVILTNYDEKAQTTPREPYTHEGEELGFVLEGSFEVTIDGEPYLLEAGDSIYYKSHLPHTVRPVGDDPVTTIWVITPPSF